MPEKKKKKKERGKGGNEDAEEEETENEIVVKGEKGKMENMVEDIESRVTGFLIGTNNCLTSSD